MVDQCPKCEKYSEGYIISTDRFVGDKFDILNIIWRFSCPKCDNNWTKNSSKRDYLGEADSGPDDMQGSRIGL